MEEPPPAPRRRLPTKTRSGIITLPPPAGDEGSRSDSPRLVSPLMAPGITTRAPVSEPLESLQSDDAVIPSAAPDIHVSPTSVNLEQSHASSSRTEESPAPPSSSCRACTQLKEDVFPSEEQPRPKKYGPPKQAPKPAPLSTGPLNSTTTPQVQSLPVTRRGSFALLKRQQQACGAGSGSGAEEEGAPSVLGMLKKATHWEVRGNGDVDFRTRALVCVCVCAWGGSAVHGHAVAGLVCWWTGFAMRACMHASVCVWGGFAMHASVCSPTLDNSRYQIRPNPTESNPSPPPALRDHPGAGVHVQRDA